MERSKPCLLARGQGIADNDHEVTVAVNISITQRKRAHQIDTDEIRFQDASDVLHQVLEKPVELRELCRLVVRHEGDASRPRPVGPGILRHPENQQ